MTTFRYKSHTAKQIQNFENDEEGSETVSDSPHDIFEEQVLSTTYHIYLYDEIMEPGKYGNMLHLLNSATSKDVFKFYINTPGGDVATGISIINAIKQSEATVITIMDGDVKSLGTFIFLSGDVKIVNNHGIMMVHTYSGAAYGKSNEMASQTAAENKQFELLAEEVYHNFLTSDEIRNVLSGSDIWLTSNEVRERLTKNYEPDDSRGN